MQDEGFRVIGYRAIGKIKNSLGLNLRLFFIPNPITLRPYYPTTL